MADVGKGERQRRCRVRLSASRAEASAPAYIASVVRAKKRFMAGPSVSGGNLNLELRPSWLRLNLWVCLSSTFVAKRSCFLLRVRTRMPTNDR